MPASRRILAVLVLALLPAAAPALAQSPRDRELPRKEISEAAAAGFGKLQPLLDARRHAEALALVDQLLARAAPAGYDAYVLLQLRAQIFLAESRYAEAIAPLERAHALAEGNPNFLDAPAHLERLHLLAQLHYQVGADAKDSPARRAGYETALAWVERWFARAPAPTPELRLFASSVLYQLATLENPPRRDRLREALGHAEEALLLSVRPSPQVRLVLVACLLQLDEHARAAEQLELLVEQAPQESSGWSQLLSLYLGAAAAATEPAEARAQNLRALHTLDRARTLGHLASPQDNYTRVALLFNLGRYALAAEALEAGLADGSLENTRRNWELLASAYQQGDRPARAIDALSRAVARFPEDGPLELTLSHLLHAHGDAAQAYERGRSALAKPGHERLGQARLQLAFLAYELQRHEDAARWIAAAREAGDAPAESLEPLHRAIQDALSARRD